MPERVDAGVKWMQTPTCDPMLNRILAEAQLP